MPSALKLRTDHTAADLRRLAKQARDNNQSRRLLSLTAVLDGMNRTDAARIGGMDRQTPRDWVRHSMIVKVGLFAFSSANYSGPSSNSSKSIIPVRERDCPKTARAEGMRPSE